MVRGFLEASDCVLAIPPKRQSHASVCGYVAPTRTSSPLLPFLSMHVSETTGYAVENEREKSRGGRLGRRQDRRRAPSETGHAKYSCHFSPVIDGCRIGQVRGSPSPGHAGPSPSRSPLTRLLDGAKTASPWTAPVPPTRSSSAHSANAERSRSAGHSSDRARRLAGLAGLAG